MVTGAHFSYMIKRVYEDRVLIPIHPSYPQSTLLVFTEEVWRLRKKATNIKIFLFVQYLGIYLRESNLYNSYNHSKKYNY